MTYDNLAKALINESAYNVDNEINNFNKILESINILNENGILLEAIDKEAIKEKLKKIWDHIKEGFKKIVEKIKNFITNTIDNIVLADKRIISYKVKDVFVFLDDLNKILNSSDYTTLCNYIKSGNGSVSKDNAENILNQVNDLYDTMDQSAADKVLKGNALFAKNRLEKIKKSFSDIEAVQKDNIEIAEKYMNQDQTVEEVYEIFNIFTQISSKILSISNMAMRYIVYEIGQMKSTGFFTLIYDKNMSAY